MSHRDLHPFTPLKLLRHSNLVQQAEAGMWVAPVSVELDLSNTCNHSCPWCSFHGFRHEHWKQLDGTRVLGLLDEFAEIGVQSVTYTGGGEPLVHKRITEILAKTVEVGIQFGVVTNGTLLRDEVAGLCALHARFVRVSLDAGSEFTHQLLHATPKREYFQILENIRRVRADGGPALTIGVSFCVFDLNWQEIPQAVSAAKAAGADYLEVRPVLPTDWRGGGFSEVLSSENVSKTMDLIERVREDLNGDPFKVIGMARRFESLNRPGKPYRRCHIGPLTTVVNADGNVYHCCQQRGQPDFIVGSILEHSFRDIWLTPEHRALLARIDVSLCPTCRYDGYNELIEAEFEQDALHSRFI